MSQNLAEILRYYADLGVREVAASPARPAEAPRPPAPRPARASVPPSRPQPSASASPMPASPLPIPFPSLPVMADHARGCTRCQLSERRTQVVFGVGNPQARLMFIGEGPGADEDRLGEPFVGEAGQMLTRMIQNVFRLQRSDVYIANVVKCRPPGNRTPLPEEVSTCLPYLREQVRLIAPEVIVLLGKVAASAMLGRDIAITRQRGTWVDIDGIPAMMTFHPAYLLRKPEDKKLVWADLNLVVAKLGLAAS